MLYPEAFTSYGIGFPDIQHKIIVLFQKKEGRTPIIV
jgi:hypothetical protein